MKASVRIEMQEFLSRLAKDRYSLKLELSGLPIDFRPPLGWRVDRNGLSAELFYFCLAGKMTVEVGGQSEALPAGHAIWIPSGRSFRMTAQDPAATRLARFRIQMSDGDGRRFALKSNYCRSAAEATSSGWLEVLRQECLLSTGRAHPELCYAVAGLLRSTFAPGGAVLAADGNDRRLSVAQLRRLQDWLQGLDPQSRPTTTDLASCLQLSTDYFNRLCRATLHMSAERWVIKQRVEAAAARLVESDRTIGEVADEYGYSSLYFFSRQFRKIQGISPREYRARYGARLAES